VSSLAFFSKPDANAGVRCARNEYGIRKDSENE
jgi:hypothetical protein